MEREVHQWKLKEAHEWMAKLEARLDKLETPSVESKTSEVVDLTLGEDEGGVGGLIILAEETPAPKSVVLCQGHSSPWASRPQSIPQDYYPPLVPLEEPK